MGTTVNVLCYKSKKLSSGEHPLMIRVCKDGKKKYVSLGISILPKYWDFVKSKPKSNYPHKEVLNQMISAKVEEYEEQIMAYKTVNRDFTASTLINKLNTHTKSVTVFQIFEEYILRLKSENRTTYAALFRGSLTSIRKFCRGEDLLVLDIDVIWLKRYEMYLKKDEMSINRMGTFFRHIRVIWNLAIEKHIVKADLYPFRDFKLSRFFQPAMKRALNKDDVKRVIAYSGTTFYEELAVDIFSFSYYTGGINFVDMANLKCDRIMDGRIVYTRKKTKKQICLPLQADALKIIEKYRQDNATYIFPILSNYHVTEAQKSNRIHKVYAKVTKHLKEIGEELNLPIKLTTYVARHSFATVLKRSGVSTSIISESLGHSSERVTQFYLDSFDNEQMNEAMKNLL